MITGKILRAEESTDGRQNIKIIVEFSEDGNVIVPEWILWARFENFLGFTKEQISEWIRINIEAQIGNLIMASNRASINTDMMAAIESLKENVYQTDKVDIPIEASLVVAEPYVVTISKDGTITTATAVQAEAVK